MLFNSPVFLVFAAVFFLAWPWCRQGNRRRWVALTLFSFLFYGWWDPRFLLLICASGFLDFWAGRSMQRDPDRKRFYLWASILGNVGSLAAFKYLGFLTGSLQAMGLDVPLLVLPLPVGISFYTFQSMSYTIDIYRGRLEPTQDLWHFFAYLAMFPQLVAGPIIRARDLLPQLAETPRSPDEAARFEGTRWLVHGYFKKVVIADNLAPFVNEAFATGPEPASAVYWWVIMLLFGAQIYCDFSGYSDIARGLARWMGYEFPRNFDHPWARSSLREFWQTWHITLTTWFGDYVYVPLGGSRGTRFQVYRNILAVWAISGLWHGAAWTYVLWGCYQGLCLAIERATRWPDHLARLPGGRGLGALVVLAEMSFGWALFRAESMAQSVQIMERLLDLTRPGFEALAGIHDRAWIYLALVVGREAWMFFGMSRSRFARASAWRWLEPLQFVAMLLACVFLRGPGSDFIYFQF